MYGISLKQKKTNAITSNTFSRVSILFLFFFCFPNNSEQEDTALFICTMPYTLMKVATAAVVKAFVRPSARKRFQSSFVRLSVGLVGPAPWSFVRTAA